MRVDLGSEPALDFPFPAVALSGFVICAPFFLGRPLFFGGSGFHPLRWMIRCPTSLCSL